jgi:hypothetical protein
MWSRNVSKRLDPVKVDRLRVLWTGGLPPKILSDRLSIPKRTVFLYLKHFREVEGLVQRKNSQNEA